jgi:hypothetical protein
MASNAAIEGVAGAAAGMVALVATYPLMTVRCSRYLLISTCDSETRGRLLWPGEQRERKSGEETLSSEAETV